MIKDPERLRDQLLRRDPTPFVDALAMVLEAAPSPEDLKVWAARHPDGWGRLSKALAAMVGYSENVAVDHRHRVVIEAMSDMELLAFVREQRKALPLPVLDAEVVPVETKGGPANTGPDPGDLRRMGLGVPTTDGNTISVPLATADTSEEEQPK